MHRLDDSFVYAALEYSDGLGAYADDGSAEVHAAVKVLLNCTGLMTVFVVKTEDE